MPSQYSMDDDDNRDTPGWQPWLCLLLLAAVYSSLVIAHWNRGYLDFGDGNYMYDSWRISQGAILYKEILAPQPPLHLLIGSVIARAASLAGLGHPLFAFRAFSVLLHLATMVLVYLIARKIFSQSSQELDNQEYGVSQRLFPWWAPVVAAAIYLVLPIGFWWTLGYQSQPLLIFFLLLTFYQLLFQTAWSCTGAGFTAACAVLTNMTTVPYVIFNAVWLLFRRPRRFFWYLLPLVAVTGAVIYGMEKWTGAYLDNVVRNQVGAFPRKELLPPGQSAITYAIDKLKKQGLETLNLEAGYIALALAGFLLFCRRSRMGLREYVAWYTVASFCALVYVAKGGTMNYVFSVSEPFVAIWAAWMIGDLITRLGRQGHPPRSLMRDTSPLAAFAAAAMLLIAVAWPGMRHSWLTLKQYTYEYPEVETMRIVERIEHNSSPNDQILSPPFYAFMAKRRIAEDFSELFLWKLKYLNEVVDKKPGRAMATVNRIAKLLREKKLPLLVLDLDQTGQIPEIKQAVDQYYTPMLAEPIRTLNTPIQFYKPKPVSAAVNPPPATVPEPAVTPTPAPAIAPAATPAPATPPTPVTASSNPATTISFSPATRVLRP